MRLIEVEWAGTRILAKQMLVTFDMTGVKKQDMHVSYRTSRLIVSWRVERTVERQDGDVVVREREVRRYSHTIPLPDGTKVRRLLRVPGHCVVTDSAGGQFEEVRASRDGQKLTLTLPNLKCVRAEAEQEQEQTPDPRTIPDIDVRVLSFLLDRYSSTTVGQTALSGFSDYHSC